ncbi:nuclear transport factor 2 family protein [Amycolatopsis japonica]
MRSTESEIRDLGARWADAEVRGDTEALDAMTTADFTLVGPLGFVLGKPQWLQRYRGGDLVTEKLDWTEVDVREHGTAAVSVGVHAQEGAHQGNRVDGRFRVTHVFVRDDDRWLIAGIHLSPIGGPPPFARPEAPGR